LGLDEKQKQKQMRQWLLGFCPALERLCRTSIVGRTKAPAIEDAKMELEERGC
jgi:hypothetical protein